MTSSASSQNSSISYRRLAQLTLGRCRGRRRYQRASLLYLSALRRVAARRDYPQRRAAHVTAAHPHLLVCERARGGHYLSAFGKIYGPSSADFLRCCRGGFRRFSFHALHHPRCAPPYDRCPRASTRAASACGGVGAA